MNKIYFYYYQKSILIIICQAAIKYPHRFIPWTYPRIALINKLVVDVNITLLLAPLELINRNCVNQLKAHLPCEIFCIPELFQARNVFVHIMFVLLLSKLSRFDLLNFSGESVLLRFILAEELRTHTRRDPARHLILIHRLHQAVKLCNAFLCLAELFFVRGNLLALLSLLSCKELLSRLYFIFLNELYHRANIIQHDLLNRSLADIVRMAYFLAEL